MSIVATSTCHAEYVASCEAAREAVCLRTLRTEIGFVIKSPNILMEDKAAAKTTAERVGVTDANKHIQVKWHVVRQCVRDGTIKLLTVSRRNNPAYALTKAPTIQSLFVMMEAAGMSVVDEYGVRDSLSDQGG
ncbi:hypothetical protein BVRB_031080, partial [Beta vulgaris subsp. vulgaris]